MSRRVRKGATEPRGKSNRLSSRLKADETPDAAKAELMVEGLGTNAATAAAYSRMLGGLDLTECMVALIKETRKIQEGNLGGLEAVLAAQAVSPLSHCLLDGEAYVQSSTP